MFIGPHNALFRLLLAFVVVNYACTKRAAGIASNRHFQNDLVAIDRCFEVARWNTCGRATVTCCIESDVFAIELAIRDRRISRPRPDGNQSTDYPTVDLEVEKNGTHRLRLFPWALKIYRPLSGDLVDWGRAQGRRRH
jgi:hypothetical protein